jgi:hypothetical protein
MSARLTAAMLFILGANVCLGSDWTDPIGDLLPEATAPAFDFVDVSVRLEPCTLAVELSFDPAGTTSEDLLQLSATVDFDADSDLNTGEPSHIDQFGLDPPLAMGVDCYIQFYPYLDMAELVGATATEEWSLGFYPVQINGTDVSVEIPRCGSDTCNGIPIEGRFQFAVLVGNLDGPTDRAPNGETPFEAVPVPEDLDADGDVDGDDFLLFNGCISGPSIPQTDDDCLKADFDGDGDVDQEDFGLFQSSITGSCH